MVTLHLKWLFSALVSHLVSNMVPALPISFQTGGSHHDSPSGPTYRQGSKGLSVRHGNYHKLNNENKRDIERGRIE